MAASALQNRYDGVLEAGVVRHAIRRMKRLGFRRDDWEDVLQELAVHVLATGPQAKTDAERQSVLCGTVNHWLVSMLRRQRCHEKLLETLTHDETYEEPFGLAPDVRKALADMTDRERRVCAGLIADLSLSQIARAMSCDRGTVRRIRDDIYGRFLRLGLDGWVR